MVSGSSSKTFGSHLWLAAVLDSYFIGKREGCLTVYVPSALSYQHSVGDTEFKLRGLGSQEQMLVVLLEASTLGSSQGFCGKWALLRGLPS